jgi:hypothetical protein
MNISKYHRYSNCAGQTLKWLDSDNHEVYKRNICVPEKLELIKQFGWDNPDIITYNMNSAGFRTNEFDQESSYIALGCSFTTGIGLPNDQIWPTLVSKQTGKQVWNLGIGGSSMDTCFRLLYNYINNLNVQAVLFLRPSGLRFEIYYNNRIEFAMPSKTPESTLLTNTVKLWYADQQNEFINSTKNTLAIQALCHARNIKLIIKDVETDMCGLPAQYPFPTARDLTHSGFVEHQECARRFIESLN